MLNEISIIPITGSNATISFRGKFQDKTTRKQIILLNNYKVLIDMDPAPHQKVFEFNFSPTTPVFNFQWKKEDADKTEWAYWILQHPYMLHPENKNSEGSHYFQAIDKSKEDENNYQRDNTKVVAYQFVKDMGAKELMEVAFFCMVNPSGMSAIKIFNLLCNLQTGIIMQDPAKFMREWKMPDSSKRTVIRKAILLKIIDSRDAIYYINNSPVGNLENLIVYMNDNEKYYDYLQKEVAKTDTLPFGVTEDILVETAIEKKKKEENPPINNKVKSAEEKAELQSERKEKENEAYRRMNVQKARLKMLGVKGWHICDRWDEETRLRKITEAEAKPKQELVA